MMMFKKINLLVLTDHSTHSDQNSFYGIVNSLLNHRDIKNIGVATRGDQRNDQFFKGSDVNSLHVLMIENKIDYYTFPNHLSKSERIDLKSFDFILLRLPRPIPDQFFPMIQANIEEWKVINRPSGIIITSSKAFLLKIERWCPPIRIINNWNELTEFYGKHPIVLKPLYSYGGKGIIRIKDDMVSIEGKNDIPIEVFKEVFESYANPYLGMQYLENVHLGDKRIVVAGGEVIATSLRLPSASGWICNVAMGGTATSSDLDPNEMVIVKDINPLMNELGIFLYGLDTLVDNAGKRVISEINTLSVGGITPAEKYYNEPITDIFANKLLEHCRKLWKTNSTSHQSI